MAVYNSDPNRTMEHRHRQRKSIILHPPFFQHSSGHSKHAIAHLIVIPSYNMHIRRDCLQILVRFLVTDIPRAKDLLYFPWYQEFPELGREVMDAMGDVEVSDDQDEDH